MIKKIKLATVFSGIGAIEFAFKRLGINHDIAFACDNGERDLDIDSDKALSDIKKLNDIISKKEYVDNLYKERIRKVNYVKQSYLANYKLDECLFFEDIRLLDGIDFANKVDLFVGGSPCQSFSSVGYQKGLEDARGTLFYEYIRLLKEIKPKVFIYENVKNLIKHDGGNTWQIIYNIFKETEYEIFYKVLNAVNFNIPQTRNRIFVIGIRKDILKGRVYEIPEKNVDTLSYTMQDFLLDNCPFNNFTYDKKGKLKIEKGHEEVDSKYFLSPQVRKYVLTPGTKNFRTTIKTDLPIARTLLKTMGNKHRAGVDNYVTYDKNAEKIRMLTEREALRLMGFTDDFKIVVNKGASYKQAGNSIVVDIMMELVKSLLPYFVEEDN